MSYLWVEGDLIKVAADPSGIPEYLVWQGQRHRVLEIANHWRIDEDWWFERVWRDYFILTTDTGLLLTLFHHLPEGSWYVQRLFD